MTEAMIEKARINVEKLGFKNVEFRLGDIEEYAGESDNQLMLLSAIVF